METGIHGCCYIWLGKSAILTTSAVIYIPKNQLIHPMKTIQNNSTSSPEALCSSKQNLLLDTQSFYIEEIQAEEVRRGKQK